MLSIEHDHDIETATQGDPEHLVTRDTNVAVEVSQV